MSQVINQEYFSLVFVLFVSAQVFAYLIIYCKNIDDFYDYAAEQKAEDEARRLIAVEKERKRVEYLFRPKYEIYGFDPKKFRTKQDR